MSNTRTISWAAEHRRVDRLGPDAVGDRLLAAARDWVACHAEIAVLLDRPEPPEVGQVPAVGRMPRPTPSVPEPRCPRQHPPQAQQ